MTVSPIFDKINSWLAAPSTENNKRYVWILDKVGNVNWKLRSHYSRFKETGRLQSVFSQMLKTLNENMEIQNENEAAILINLRARVNSCFEKYNKKHRCLFGFIYKLIFAYSLKKIHAKINHKIEDCLSNHLHNLSNEQFREFVKNRPLTEGISREKLDKEKISILIKENLYKFDRLNIDCQNIVRKMAPHMNEEELKVLCKFISLSDLVLEKFNLSQKKCIINEFADKKLTEEESQILGNHFSFLTLDKFKIYVQDKSILLFEFSKFNFSEPQKQVILEEGLRQIKTLQEKELAFLLSKHSIMNENQFRTLVEGLSLEKVSFTPSSKQIKILIEINLPKIDTLSENEVNQLLKYSKHMSLEQFNELTKKYSITRFTADALNAEQIESLLKTNFSKIDSLPKSERAKFSEYFDKMSLEQFKVFLDKIESDPNFIEKLNLDLLKGEKCQTFLKRYLNNINSLTNNELTKLITLIPQMDDKSLKVFIQKVPFSEDVFKQFITIDGEKMAVSSKVKIAINERINLLPNINADETEFLCLLSQHLPKETFDSSSFKKLIQHAGIKYFDELKVLPDIHFNTLLEHCLKNIDVLTKEEISQLLRVRNRIPRDQLTTILSKDVDTFLENQKGPVENGLNEEQAEMFLKKMLVLLNKDTESLTDQADAFLMRNLNKITDAKQFAQYLRLTNYELPLSSLNPGQIVLGLKKGKIALHLLSNEQIKAVFGPKYIKHFPANLIPQLTYRHFKALGNLIFDLDDEKLELLDQNNLTAEQKATLMSKLSPTK